MMRLASAPANQPPRPAGGERMKVRGSLVSISRLSVGSYCGSKPQISVFKSHITISCRAARRMGLASARDSRPPRPACGERIEVRGFFVRRFRFKVRRYNGLW
jgi:hypothetical protein